MPDISKVTVSNVTYDVKDAYTRANYRTNAAQDAKDASQDAQIAAAAKSATELFAVEDGYLCQVVNE